MYVCVWGGGGGGVGGALFFLFWLENIDSGYSLEQLHRGVLISTDNPCLKQILGSYHRLSTEKCHS